MASSLGRWTKTAIFGALFIGLLLGVVGIIGLWSRLSSGLPLNQRSPWFAFLATVDGVTGLLSAYFLWVVRKYAPYLFAAFTIGFVALIVYAAITTKPSSPAWLSVVIFGVCGAAAVRGVIREARIASSP